VGDPVSTPQHWRNGASYCGPYAFTLSGATGAKRYTLRKNGKIIGQGSLRNAMLKAAFGRLQAFEPKNAAVTHSNASARLKAFERKTAAVTHSNASARVKAFNVITDLIESEAR
jgi:hypothetical protein